MAIKIECQVCGFKNDLGRVFCIKCGKRMELTHTSLGELSNERTFLWGRIIRRLVAAGLALAAIGIVGAALWPLKPPAIQIDPAGPKAVDRILRRDWRTLRQGPLVLMETQVNGFLDARARSRHLKKLAIDFKPGSFTLSAWRLWTPLPRVAVVTNVVIPVSYGLMGRFDEGHLVIQGGQVGHLPLPAPLASLTTPWFSGWLDDVLAQTGMVGALKSVTLDEHAATLVFGP